MRVLEEEVEVGFDLGVGGGLDVVGSHLLLVLTEVRQLVLHVLVLQLLLLAVDVQLPRATVTSSCCFTASARTSFSPSSPSYFF